MEMKKEISHTITLTHIGVEDRNFLIKIFVLTINQTLLDQEIQIIFLEPRTIFDNLLTHKTQVDLQLSIVVIAVTLDTTKATVIPLDDINLKRRKSPLHALTVTKKAITH